MSEPTKTCSACKEGKSLKDFYVRDKKTQRRATVCKTCDKERIRMRYLQSKFGISYDDYCEMERNQNVVCAICGQFETHRRGQRLCVDHDHETGKTRGLLCHHCNTGIGLLGDNISTLQNAIDYLTRHEPQPL